MSLNFTERKSAFNNQRFPVNRLIHYIQWSASKPFVNWIMQIPLPTLTAQPFIRCTLSEGLFKYRKQVHTTYWMSWTHNEDKCSDTDTWIRDVIRTSAELRGKPLFPLRKGLYFICLLSFSWFALTAVRSRKRRVFRTVFFHFTFSNTLEGVFTVYATRKASMSQTLMKNSRCTWHSIPVSCRVFSFRKFNKVKVRGETFC